MSRKWLLVPSLLLLLSAGCGDTQRDQRKEQLSQENAAHQKLLKQVIQEARDHYQRSAANKSSQGFRGWTLPPAAQDAQIVFQSADLLQIRLGNCLLRGAGFSQRGGKHPQEYRDKMRASGVLLDGGETHTTVNSQTECRAVTDQKSGKPYPARWNNPASLRLLRAAWADALAYAKTKQPYPLGSMENWKPRKQTLVWAWHEDTLQLDMLIGLCRLNGHIPDRLRPGSLWQALPAQASFKTACYQPSGKTSGLPD